MATFVTSSRDEVSDEEAMVRPSPDEIKTQLNTLLASNQFSGSRRSSEFLQFIVEHALIGDTATLKERLLGIEIFHRRSDYDTSSDAIVRVTANDVRRRLVQYDQAFPDDSVRILLPPGSYLPDFIKRPGIEIPAESVHGAVSMEEQPSDDRKLSAAAHEPPLSATVANHIGPSVSYPDIPTAATVKKSPRLTILLLSAAIPMAAAAGWYASHLFSAVAHQDQAGYRCYQPLLGAIGIQPTQIALSNPHVGLYRGSATAAPQHEDEAISVTLPSDIANRLNATANDTQGSFPYHYLQIDDKNYTGIGEAQSAFGLARVFAVTGRSARLTQARFLNWDAAKDQQLVLLGAPHMSAFAQSSIEQSNFVMEHDAIINQHAQSGERPKYERRIVGTQLEDYGLIWMGKSPAGSRVLVLAGLTSTGTAGVGQFFADPKRMRKVYEELKQLSRNGNFPDTWQVLLKIEAREDVPVRVTAVAVRANDRN